MGSFLAVGKYDSYANDALRETFGDRFSTSDVVFSFGPDAGTGEVDGTIDGNIAVEIGVGSPKQIRASVFPNSLRAGPGGSDAVYRWMPGGCDPPGSIQHPSSLSPDPPDGAENPPTGWDRPLRYVFTGGDGRWAR